MKLNVDIKNKKGEFKGNVEKIIEKGMEQHEKTWKEKFSTKHTAKKEIMELKHKQSIETKEQNLKKKTLIRELFDGINENKRMKLEEKQRQEEEQKRIEEEKRRAEEERLRRVEEERIKAQKERKKLGKILLIVGLIITMIGFGLGDPDSGLQMVGSIGFIGCIVGFVLLIKNDNKKTDKK